VRFLYYALVGIVAGGIADWLFLRGDDLGMLEQMALGMAGAVIGGFVFERLQIRRGARPGCAMAIVSAVVGAGILVLVISLLVPSLS